MPQEPCEIPPCLRLRENRTGDMTETAAKVTPEPIAVKLPFIGQVTFAPNAAERKAAWMLYVELRTRVAMQPLAGEYGLMREALDSLHSLFSLTRQILREAGPDVAHNQDSLGFVAIEILSSGITPFTSK